MMPVLSHPRCANCHGGVNVETGENHPGGEVSDVPVDDQGNMLPGTQSNEQCLECHDEVALDTQISVWRLAPKHMSLINKDTLTLCQQMRTLNNLGRTGDPGTAANEAFIHHLSTDQLIGFAFEGRRGMLDTSPEPPPMNRAEFVAAASRWIEQGGARCGGWTGSIVQKTALRSHSPGSDLATDITITINVNGGSSTATVHVEGSTVQDGATVNGCRTFNHETFSADGSNLAATVAIAVTPAMAGEGLPELPPEVAELGITMPDFATGGYVITFGVPQVKGQHHIETQSVTLPPAQKCQLLTKDPPYAYAAPGGSILKSIGADQADHLVGHDVETAGGSTITTDWDLKQN